MRKAHVFVRNQFAGILSEEDNGMYIFRYDEVYFHDQTRPAISLTLPKTKKEYRSSNLFPFFFNLISEGENREIQIKALNLDQNDYFGLLLKTTAIDTIGTVTLHEIKDE